MKTELTEERVAALEKAISAFVISPVHRDTLIALCAYWREAERLNALTAREPLGGWESGEVGVDPFEPADPQ